MPLSWNEIKHRAITFPKEWKDESREKAEAESFWDAFFHVFGVQRRTVASFEEPVKKLTGDWGYINLLPPSFEFPLADLPPAQLPAPMNEAQRQQADEQWERRFSELEKYICILGHARISRADFANAGLRTWLRTQQQMAKAGTLRMERWWRLTGLGLGPLGNDERRQMRFGQLRQFRERFGHCRVPRRWKEDVPLRYWVREQRTLRRKGILKAERVRRLEAIGFQWSK